MTKWIQINHNSKGAFFRKNNRRYYLGEFMRHNFKHEGNQIHGILTLTNWHSMGIQISNDGEAVKVFFITAGE